MARQADPIRIPTSSYPLDADPASPTVSSDVIFTSWATGSTYGPVVVLGPIAVLGGAATAGETVASVRVVSVTIAAAE